MELSLICPAKHVKHTSLLPGRFCIAPAAVQHPEYKAYFIDASFSGYKVTLDNGIFEEDQLNDDDYIDLAMEMAPRVLVIPDVINASAHENWEKGIAFIERVKAAGFQEAWDRPLELMYVPQCKAGPSAEATFWQTLENAMQNPDIQWVGICRDAVYQAFGGYTHTSDQELNRFYFVTELQRRWSRHQVLRKQWHFLGIGARFDILPHYWFVSAMDTASIFLQSTYAHEITPEGILPGQTKRPVDYFVRDFGPEDTWLSTLKRNCEIAQAWAQSAIKVRRQLFGGRL